MDQLSYHYTSGTNRLEYVSDAVSNACDDYDDIEDQAAGNYTYDAIGQLTADEQAHIDSIEWDVYNKIRRITFAVNVPDPCGSGNLDLPAYIEFRGACSERSRGNGMGNRISKHVHQNAVFDQYTYYVRDASGIPVAQAHPQATGTHACAEHLPAAGHLHRHALQPAQDRADRSAALWQQPTGPAQGQAPDGALGDQRYPQQHQLQLDLRGSHPARPHHPAQPHRGPQVLRTEQSPGKSR